jgi:hypothetical protein
MTNKELHERTSGVSRGQRAGLIKSTDGKVMAMVQMIPVMGRWQDGAKISIVEALAPHREELASFLNTDDDAAMGIDVESLPAATEALEVFSLQTQ